MIEGLKNTFCRYDMVCDNPTGIGLEVNRMPAFFVEKPKLETSEKHVHGFYEIIWFEEGEGVHYVDFTKYKVEPGTVFFISPGQIHSFGPGSSHQGVVMKICSELMNDETSSESAYLRYSVFNAFDRAPYCRVPHEEKKKISTIVKAIEAELTEEDSVGHKEYLQSLIKMFVIRVQRTGIVQESATLNPVKTSHKSFLEFRRLLEENYRKAHTVKQYAMMLHITTKTLTQYVNECSTLSPLEIINNRITLEAKRLLRYSNLTVKEIAYTLGFEDPSYFVKFFKRIVKQSPADYRDPVM